LKSYIFTFFFFLSSFVFAQSGNSRVDKLAYDYAKLSYQNVIESSKTLLKKEKNLSEAQKKEILQKLSYSLFNINDYKQAEQYFSSLVKMNDVDADYLHKYAQVLAGNGKYLLASEIWSRYAQEAKGNGNAEDFSLLLSNPEALIRNAESYETHLVSINTNLAEFSPVKYKDGLVFVSNRTANSAIKRVFSWDDSPFLDLYFLENENEIRESNSSTADYSSSSHSVSTKKRKIGADSYTRQTANDGPTLGFKSTSSFFDKPELASNLFSRTLNSIYHEGPCQFFNNEKNIIFTRNGIKKLNYQSSDKLNRIHIYIAEKNEKDWGNLSAFPYNNSEYSTGHPAFMPGEQILFFVSDMPNGYGGTDIYFSKYKDGRWFGPQNAGDNINTSGNEMFPFVDEDNVLYFSSDGHPGLGGLDLFAIPLNERGLTLGNARNLGSPLNSISDDFGILTDSRLGKGYFSSNRKNGGTDDDIYSFKRIGERFGCKDVILAAKAAEDNHSLGSLKFKFYEVANTKILKDGVLDENGKAKLCLNVDSEYYFEFSSDGFEAISYNFATNDLSDFKVTTLTIELTKKSPVKQIIARPPKVLNRQRDLSLENRYKGVVYGIDNITPLEGVLIRFVNKCTDTATEYLTKEDGFYDFERDIECDYEIIAMKSGFAANYEFIPNAKKNFVANIKSTVTSRKKMEESFFDPNIFKVGDIVKMDNVYYESKDDELDSRSKNDLDQLILVMETYRAMVIEIFSHTDSRGNDRENLILSQKRANEVKGYLIKKGISPLRIRAVGMGEGQPVNSCGDGIQCTEAEYRRNRRIEFKILKIERI
jgi:outer membrane protein OmpA-like peptidoglycan-associated protein